jgi:hypothetical protein
MASIQSGAERGEQTGVLTGHDTLARAEVVHST